MSTVAPPLATAPRWGPGRVALLVVGTLLALVGAGLVAGGGVIVWADETQRDEAGFFTTPTARFATADYAITHEGVEIALGRPGEWELVQGRVTARVEATGTAPVFVGVGPAADVDAYLAGVAHARVDEVDYSPFRVRYLPREGTSFPAPPGEQAFWAASTEGAGTQSLAWDVESGDWALVLMNADGSRGVAADLQFGGRVDFLGWIAVGLFAAGALFLGIGAALILLAVSRGRGAGPEYALAGGGAVALDEPTDYAAYPVAVEGELDPRLSRWLWLVKWFLAIPHLVVLAFLWIAAIVMWVVALFAVVFTGRYPRSIFDFELGVLRWSWRVSFYAFALGTDRYPPFSLGPEPDYPARLEVPYAEELSRGKALVKWWLLAIPHYLVVGIFFGSWFLWGAWDGRGPSLHFVLVVIAGVVLLFRTHYPREIFELVLGMYRWGFRVAAYALLMRDEYPPFRLGR